MRYERVAGRSEAKDLLGRVVVFDVRSFCKLHMCVRVLLAASWLLFIAVVVHHLFVHFRRFLPFFLEQILLVIPKRVRQQIAAQADSGFLLRADVIAALSSLVCKQKNFCTYLTPESKKTKSVIRASGTGYYRIPIARITDLVFLHCDLW